jgi:NAD(P)H-nitrite reductase large subunit
MGPRKTPKYLCECLKITEAQVAEAIEEHSFCTLKEVTACTEAGAGCNVCHPAIKALLERRAKEASLRGEPASNAAAPRAAAPSSYAADQR